MATLAELKKDFDHLVKTERLAHGYLIFGGRDDRRAAADEKFILAEELAARLEGGRVGDLLIDAMTINARVDSGIDGVRAAIRFLWQKPVKSACRTLIICSGDQLTSQAEQAILKTAEEPPSHGLIIITARSLAGVSAPLASRLQKIFLSPRANFAAQEISNKQAVDFRAADQKQRAMIIKEVAVSHQLTLDFIADLIQFAAQDPQRNGPLLRALLDGLRVISEYNTNKRLQLEAILLAAVF